jgi:DNA processing protein
MPIASDDEQFLRLTLIPGIGSRSAHKLLSKFGDVSAVFDASEASVAAVLGEAMARKFVAARNKVAPELVDTALAWLEGEHHHLLTWSHAAYPRSLLESGDAPIALYALGDLSALQSPAIALVGSRNCSQGGRETAEAFAESLVNAGLVVVSGLALGIDAAAHTGALRAKATGAKTIAVIGTGVDRVYPARNKTLAHAIAEQGLIVSEYPLGTPPLAENFPRRNRIISGLSRGVLVVEASMQSGSLITARLAAEQGRDVFAIPGSIHSTFHKGCHHLIKQGAKLVESSQDVLEELGLGASNGTAVDAKTQSDAGEIAGLLRHIEHTPIDIDSLVARSGMNVDELVAELTVLELDGRVESLAGGLWQRID